MRRLWKYRHLAFSLARREFQIRYRQSFLGLLWAFILPLAALGAGSLVFKTIAGLHVKGESYELTTFAALVPWTFFASGLSFGVGSVVGQKSMVTKLNFPRFVLPLGMVGVSFLDLAISGSIFVGLAYLIGDGLRLTALWVPLLLLIEVAFVIGLAFFGSALNVFARDIRFAVPLLVQLWFLLTPVLYPLEAVPRELRSWYMANPMTGLVESFRRVLLVGQGPDLTLLLPAVLGSVVSLVIGSLYFWSTEKRFADVI
jgi:lipopolysaccharide transport system permease protein